MVALFYAWKVSSEAGGEIGFVMQVKGVHSLMSGK